MMDIIEATRDPSAFALGASPRAAIGLYKAAQARAALSGREFVMPEDVKSMAPHVLAHRLVPKRPGLRDSAGFISDLLAKIKVPTEDI